MVLELNKDIRPRQREASEQLDNLRQEISREINKKYEESKKAMRNDIDSLYKMERDFIDSIATLFKNKQLDLGSKIKVTVQVGSDSSILREHKGVITKIHDLRRPCFDLSDPNYLGGKKFTVGSSCIQKLEML